VLVRIADYSEDSVRLNNRVMSILTYPLFMLAFAGVVVGVMSTSCCPDHRALIAQKLELPWYTKAVIGFSELLRGYWWLLLLLLVGRSSATAPSAGPSAAAPFSIGSGCASRSSAASSSCSRSPASRAPSLAAREQRQHRPGLNIARHVANNTVYEAASDMARDAILEGASSPSRCARAVIFRRS